MKKLLNICLLFLISSFPLSAQIVNLGEEQSWVVLLGVYDEPLPEYYFNSQVLGPVEVEWNGYFYSYYTKELGSEEAAKELRAKAYHLGHVSAAVTNERHAEHPCVFCASIRDSACWNGGGKCSLPNYPRHDNFGAYIDLGGLNNHGMRPDVEVRKSHNPRPDDVEGTHFYVLPTPNEKAKQMMAATEKNKGNMPKPAIESIPKNADRQVIANQNMIAMNQSRGAAAKNDDEMVPKSIDPIVEKKPAIVEKPVAAARNLESKPVKAPSKEVSPLVKGTYYFAQIVATSSDIVPDIEMDTYSMFKDAKDGMNKYVVGPFKDYASCVEYCKSVKEKGFDGAFPVTYKDGVRTK